MNSKMTTNSQLATTEPTNTKNINEHKQLEQEQLQKWRSHERFSVGRGWRENGRKGTGNKKHKW